MYRKSASWPALLVGLASGSCFLIGIFLAAHHPLWPTAALAVFYLACVAFAFWPRIWLLVVPACLPWLDFSPWTGWLLVQEFDLLLLAVVAGGYAQMAWHYYRPSAVVESAGSLRLPAAIHPRDPALAALLLGLGTFGILATVRGLQDAGGISLAWFQGYTDAGNSLRVSKSMVFGLLMLPLLRQEMQISRSRASERLAVGMGLGLACVCMATVWERIAFPGLLDFSRAYRTTALFWEMHVGGAAIDAYLAMATPFAIWGLARARRPAIWLLSAALTLLTGYACLTTFSRGVYLAILLPLPAVGAMALFRRTPLRPRAGKSRFIVSCLIGGTIVWLVLAALGSETFLTNRLIYTERVFDGRMAHWSRALNLLQSRTDWLFGIGAGRFPAHYDASDSQGRFAGSVQLGAPEAGTAAAHGFAALRGPVAGASNGGLFALTQRVDLGPGVVYRMEMDVRATADALVLVKLCERHLLYDRRCQQALLRVPAGTPEWQHRVFSLAGAAFSPQPWYATRLGMLSLSVIGDDSTAALTNLRLTALNPTNLIANGDFSAGMSRWFPAAQYYYLPWHADSLYLEVLVERGAAGLALLASMLLLAFVRLGRQGQKDNMLSSYLVVSLAGAVLVGSVSSVMDAPRVAFLLYFLTFFAIASATKAPADAPTPGHAAA